MERGVFLGGQPRPYRKGTGPQRFFRQQFLEFRYSHRLWRRITKFDVVTHVGEERVGSATPPIPREQSFSVPPTFGVLLYLCLHPFTQNDQIRHGNQYGEERILGQPLHCVCTNASRDLSAMAEFLACISLEYLHRTWRRFASIVFY